VILLLDENPKLRKNIKVIIFDMKNPLLILSIDRLEFNKNERTI
jgi:hypothetical protein